jgi:hypothetical protein
MNTQAKAKYDEWSFFLRRLLFLISTPDQAVWCAGGTSGRVLALHVIGHFLAGFRTAATDLGAAFHGLIARVNALAILGAVFTHAGAHAAGQPVARRAAEHVVPADQANLSAVHEQADVFGFRVLSALLQTMGDGLHANGMALLAKLGALFYFRIGGDGLRHWMSPFPNEDRSIKWTGERAMKGV